MRGRKLTSSHWEGRTSQQIIRGNNERHDSEGLSKVKMIGTTYNMSVGMATFPIFTTLA